METVKPDICKILQMNDILGESERFRIVFPLVVDVISRSHHRYSYQGSFWFTFCFSKHRQAQWENYIWFRNKTTLGQKKKKEKKEKNDRVFCFIKRTVSNNVKDNLL